VAIRIATRLLATHPASRRITLAFVISVKLSLFSYRRQVDSACRSGPSSVDEVISYHRRRQQIGVGSFHALTEEHWWLVVGSARGGFGVSYRRPVAVSDLRSGATTPIRDHVFWARLAATAVAATLLRRPRR
jgi:hypothetical protein